MIVVHVGRAHADDFLAACVCLHKTGLEVHRSDFKDAMLDDPGVWVLDQGRRFEPELKNFDHHQIEEEKCSLTMVLDHFYGPGYRDHMPELRFLEILDSYGPARAAEFAGMKEDRIDFVSSPIQNGILGVFSDIDGLVKDPMRSIMGLIGADLCGRIEDMNPLLAALERASMGDVEGVSILDVTMCSPPPGHNHSSLPTKLWCKIKGFNPVAILTRDPRQEGFFRMVSINTDTLRFKANPMSCFTHNSGFLTVFQNYEDHRAILKNYKHE